MKTIQHNFLLAAAALILMACDHSEFPSGPVMNEKGYDTVNCSGWNIPAGAITVREALKIGKNLSDGGVTDDFYYVKGIVTELDNSLDSKTNLPKHDTGMKNFGNSYFYIQDNTDYEAKFYCYRTNGLNGKPFDSLPQLLVGDFVVVKCKINNFKSTIETYWKSNSSDNSELAFTTNDCAYPLTKVPYMEESFSKGLGTWSTQTVSGTATDIWTVTTGTNSYIMADSKGTPCESWLISPEFNVGTTHESPVKLYFSHAFKSSAAQDQARNYLRVKVRNNEGVWNDMAINAFGTGAMLKSYNDSLDITPYANGNIRVAFAYKSDETFKPQWKVFGISVCERKLLR